MKKFMISLCAFTTCCVALGATSALVQSNPQAPKQPLPPNHPQTPPQLPAGHPAPGQPQLPAGHPAPVQVPQGHPEAQSGDFVPPPAPANWPAAKPEDVQSVDAIIKAYFATISGPKGQPRDWDRFRSLMCPEMMMFSTRMVGDQPVTVSLNAEKYIEVNRKYFENGGYYETEIHRSTESFGNVAHVFSTYESRRHATEAAPYVRGVNSFQLLYNGDRWWIVCLTWDLETETKRLPAELLGPGPESVSVTPAAPAPQK